MKIEIKKNLPTRINHDAIKRRIKESYGLDVGIQCDYNEDGLPAKLTLFGAEGLPVSALSEITVEPEVSEEDELEERQLETGAFKKLVNQIKELKTEITAIKSEVVLLKSKRSQ